MHRWAITISAQFKIQTMSKPKKGYKRKSLDLKEETLKKISKVAIDKGQTPKEYCESVIEKHSNKII